MLIGGRVSIIWCLFENFQNIKNIILVIFLEKIIVVSLPGGLTKIMVRRRPLGSQRCRKLLLLIRGIVLKTIENNTSITMIGVLSSTCSPLPTGLEAEGKDKWFIKHIRKNYPRGTARFNLEALFV